MKKIIAVLMAVIMCLPMLCINAFATSDYTVKLSRTYCNGYTNVTLKAADGDLYYTTDGSKPTLSSAKYTGKIKVTEPSTLRIAVYDKGAFQKRYSAKINVRVKYPTVALSGTSNGKYVYKVSAPSGAAVYYTTNGSTPYKDNGTKITGTKSIKVAPGTTLKFIALKTGWIKSSVRTIKVSSKVPAVEESKSDFESEVLRLVNVERAKCGLKALKTTTALDKAAQIRADELVSLYSHTRPNNTSCFTVLSENDISYRNRAGENIAAGQSTPEYVVEAWMNSEGHRANILHSDYEYLGVGYAKTSSGYGHYWAQLFIG